MQDLKMVSIIIPYYNRPEKLRRCLDSILNQTYQNFEIFVVDDYSNIPLKLTIDNRIQVLRNCKNLGPGPSRNIGIENANGEYVAFLDSDDYWDPNFLERCLFQFSNALNDPGMVFTNTLSVSKNGSSPKREWNSTTEVILPDILLKKRLWSTSSCLWKTEIIKDHRWIQTRNWEDYVFDISVALKCNRVCGIDEYLVFYDAEGDDKLSKTNYFERSIEKTHSLLNIFELLKDTVYLNNKQIRNSIIDELISSLELIKRENYKEENLEEKIFNSLKPLQNRPLFNLVKFTYYTFNLSYSTKLLNKIRKNFYSV